MSSYSTPQPEAAAKVGATVHYFASQFGPDFRDHPRAAIVTRVWSADMVNLYVFADDSTNNVPRIVHAQNVASEVVAGPDASTFWRLPK